MKSIISYSFPEQLPDRPKRPSRFRNLVKNRYVQAILYCIGAMGLIVIALVLGAMLGKKSSLKEAPALRDAAVVETLHSTVTSYVTDSLRTHDTTRTEVQTETTLLTSLVPISPRLSVVSSTTKVWKTIVVGTTLAMSAEPKTT
jgi:hypothetical protein